MSGYDDITTLFNGLAQYIQAQVFPFGEILASDKLDQIREQFNYNYISPLQWQPKVEVGDGSVAVADSIMTISSITGSASIQTIKNV